MTTSITGRLVGRGLSQHLYAEPTTVQEYCSYAREACTFDWDCCYGLVCEYLACVKV